MLSHYKSFLHEETNKRKQALSFNHLVFIYGEVCDCDYDTLFVHRRNQITTFPSELCSLPLQVLNLSNNKLTSLPVEIGHLTLLQDLVSNFII